ncbi:DUF2267 domain-containing protein [Streptomyces sp. JJ36]|uniref:DUF2267 domain-containing protein n=1 Tax=Streptomyces sp. JJ36 TaxID=2736645 RepID=UPI001F322FF7|nr:DUF2267 domain-containing protein [Streptomyces sp. JJ36]MCF6523383.1 DUF2267 domain-containing protein [Streptomyces sp. JJ36]
MRYDELIGQVQAQAGLPDRGAAEHAARAVLRTLTERVPDGLARNLSAQLPEELVSPLGADAAEPAAAPPERSGSGERFDLTAFAGRVAWRSGVSEDAALRQTAAVLEVLDAAVAPEEMEKVAEVLPPDIRELLPTERASGTNP